MTNTQVPRICKAFANGWSANIKLSKTQLDKIWQSGGFLGRRLRPLRKAGVPLVTHVLKPLAKSVSVPLGLTGTASTADAVIHNKMFGPGPTTLVVYNEKINDIMKIVMTLEESGLLIKGVSERTNTEEKEN